MGDLVLTKHSVMRGMGSDTDSTGFDNEKKNNMFVILHVLDS